MSKILGLFPVLMLIGGIMLMAGGNGGGGSVVPDVTPASDLAAKCFRDQEAGWRRTQGEKAVKLRAGEFANERASEAWFLSEYGKIVKEAWVPVLNAEFESYGGDSWTAEKEASIAEGYAK